MPDLGQWGNLARQHMARWLPETLAAIGPENETTYFRALDERVAARISSLERSSTPPTISPQTDPMGHLGQVRMTRAVAEEQALMELVYLDPEPGADPDDPTVNDPGWEPLEPIVDPADLDEAGDPEG